MGERAPLVRSLSTTLAAWRTETSSASRATDVSTAVLHDGSGSDVVAVEAQYQK